MFLPVACGYNKLLLRVLQTGKMMMLIHMHIQLL